MQERGWCRLEQWARLCESGGEDMFLYDGGDALREALSGKASVDEMNAQLARKAQQTGLALQQKVDGRELRQAVERVEARIASAADELRGLVAADQGRA